MPTNQRDEVIRLIFQATGNDQLATTAGNLYDMAEAGGVAGQRAQELLDAIQKFAGEDALTKRLTEETAGAALAAKALDDAQKKLIDLGAQQGAAANTSAALQKAIDKQKSAVDSASESYQRHQAAVTAATNALKAAGVDTGNLDSEQRRIAASLAEAKSQADNFGRSIGTAGEATEEAGKKAEASGTFFDFVRDHLKEIISIAAAAELALKGIEFGKESLSGAADVEASLSRVRALAQGAADDFGEMDEAVEKAAEAVNGTTKDAAAGLAALVGSGLDAKNAIEALVPTLQLAKIANVDVGTAAGVVARTLDAFGLTAASAQEVVDKLTFASHGAAGGLSSIGSAVATLAPDARALGIDLNTLVSIVGVLGQHGIESEKSLQGLRTLFQALQDPASTLRQQLLVLGDGTSNFGRAIAALSGNSRPAQQALLGLDGTTRSLVLALGQAGPDALSKLQAQLDQTGGAAKRISNAIDQNLNGAWKAFSNAVADVGEKLAKPILEPLAAELTKLAGQINEFAKSDDFNTITEKVGEMARNAAKAFDQFINNTDFKGFADNAIKDLDGLAKSLETLADNASTIATAIGKVTDGVGVAYRGAATAIDTVVAGGAKFVDVVTDVAQAGDALVEGNDAAAKSFENVHAAVQSVGDEAWEQAKSNASDFADDVEHLAGTTDKATEAVRKQGDATTAAVPQIDQHAAALNAADRATKGFADSLGIVPDYLRAARAAADQAASGIDAFGNSTSRVKTPLDDARNALADAVIAFAKLQASGNATPEALNAASDAITHASLKLNQLSQAAATSAESLQTAFDKLKISSQQSLSDTADAFLKAFNTINQGSADTAAGLADRQNAFLAYAKTALAAVANLSDGEQAAKESELESIAASLGLTDQLQQLEDQANKTSNALRNIGRVPPGGGGQPPGLPDVKNQANDANKALQGTGESVKSLTDRVNDIGSGGFPDLTQALANTRVEFLNVSQAAAKAFDAALLGDFQQKFDATGIGFARVIGAMGQAASDVNAKIAEQRNQLMSEIGVIDQLGTTANKSFGSFGNDAAAASKQMSNLASLIASGKYDAGLLGQTDLGPLQQALEGAAQRAQSLADAAKSASDQLADANNQLLDALDDANGNATDKENRRYQQQLQQLKDLADQAGAAGQAQYQQALKNAADLHQKNMAAIAQENAAKNNASSSGSQSSSTNAGGSGAGGVGGGSDVARNALAGLSQINIHVDGALQQGHLYGDQLAATMMSAMLRSKANSI